MKNQILQALFALTLVTTSATAQQDNLNTRTASYIAMPAAVGQAEPFAEFLEGVAPLVKETEPGTELWFALRDQEMLAIFDIFSDEAARDAHFSGKVAGALQAKADRFVEGGWDRGVVANVSPSTVLSAKAPVELSTATTATYIKLKAAPGQGDNLRELLMAAGPIVADTEPQTLYWVALQIDESNFAIFDIFADDAGRDAHFAGQVAGLLKEKAANLVAGGWNDGVVANVKNFDILAMK